MNKKTIKTVAVFSLVVTVIATIGGAIGYRLALSRSAEKSVMAETANKTANNERKTLYWFDPMVPNQHFDKPGKSPFMDMQLVPQYAEEEGSGGDALAAVKISPMQMQNLGIRLSPVEQAILPIAVDAVATVQFNDRDVAIVQARSGGFVERVYARAPGDVLAGGAPLVDLVVPDWFAAQNEFLALRSSGDKFLIDAGRQRLQQLGMSADMIAKMEQSGQP